MAESPDTIVRDRFLEATAEGLVSLSKEVLRHVEGDRCGPCLERKFRLIRQNVDLLEKELNENGLL